MAERRRRAKQRGEHGRRSSAAGGRDGEEGAAAGEALTADGVEGGLGPPLEALAQLQRVLLLVQQRVRRAVHGPAPGPAGPFPLFRALPPGVLPEILDFPFRETSPGLAAGTAGRGGDPGPGWGCCPGEDSRGGGSLALPALGRAEQGTARRGFYFLYFPAGGSKSRLCWGRSC